MSSKPNDRPAKPEPYRHLLGTNDIHILWALRILVGWYNRDRSLSSHVMNLLGIKKNAAMRRAQWDESRVDALELMYSRLAETLKLLEPESKRIQLSPVLNANLELLSQHVPFSPLERAILALAISLRSNDALTVLSSATIDITSLPRTLASVLGVKAQQVEIAIAPGSQLRQSNLIEWSTVHTLYGCMKISRKAMLAFNRRKFKHLDGLFSTYLTKARPPMLRPGDYAHLRPGFNVLSQLIDEAIQLKREGVNVLLYGAPGTGKTELVRTIGKQLRVPVFNVADRDEDGHPLAPKDRLDSAVTGQFLAGRSKAIVCFDEVEGIFNDGSELFGKLSTAESQKVSFNTLLERNRAPMFWIANSIRGIDSAFARRFDLVIRLDAPPRKQRLHLLERKCGRQVPHEQLERLARIDQITPALVTRAADVVRRVGLKDAKQSGALLETVLDGVLQAQRYRPLALALHKSDTSDFDPAFCNATGDLGALAEALSRNPMGRICLYGPPGTGKTAFGHWLAERIDRTHMLRKMSDLQSPFLGVMERNLADAFEQAKRDDAVLQIDEVDSFLQDRRQAQRSWETSQVNEFLTQLESFDGVFIASTNLMVSLDPAAMRRFDYKLRMDYLRPDQAQAMLARLLARFELGNEAQAIAQLKMQKLVPGDFAVVARRHKLIPFADAQAVADALCAEAAMREPAKRAIGFV